MGLRSTTSMLGDVGNLGSGGPSSGGQGHGVTMQGYNMSNTAFTTGANTALDRGFGFADYQRYNANAYNNDTKDKIANRPRGEGQAQLDSARTWQQQNENYPFYDWNLAQNNPRGNLNRMSYGNTLRYSRLADMVNNRFHYRPGHLGHLGTGKKGVAQQSDSATVSRWQPIETEEMRQMQANRRLDEKVRGAQADLQARIEAYPQAVQEAIDEAMRNMQKFIAEQDVHFIQKQLMYRLETEYGQSWRTMFQQMVTAFDKEMELMFGERLWNAVRHLSPDIMSAILSLYSRSVVMPDLSQQASTEALARLAAQLSASGYGPEQIRQVIDMVGPKSNDVIAAFAGEQYSADPNSGGGRSSSGSGAISGFVFGAGPRDPNAGRGR